MTTIILLTVLVLGMFGLILSFIVFWRGNARVLHDLQQGLQAHTAQVGLLTARVERLEVEMRAVLERTRQVAAQPVPAPLDAELAPRLAAAGANSEELMRVCGMTNDEAELVLRLHGRSSQ